MFENFWPIDWNEFHFIRPIFLWLFVPMLLWIVVTLLSSRRDQSWQKMIASHLRPFVIQKGNEWVTIVMQGVFCLALSFGILGLSGPTWREVEVPGQELETPLVILLDLNEGMLNTDLQPNRLERAKFKIGDFLDQQPGPRMAMVGFAGTAHTIMPLTRDYNLIRNHIDGLSPDVMPVKGSFLKGAFERARAIMDSTEAPGSVLLLTDSFSDEDFQVIQDFCGTSSHKVEILFTRSNSDLSGEQELIIQKISSLDQLLFNQLTLDDSDVSAIAKRVSEDLIFQEEDEKKEDQWQDTGLIFIIPMAFLMLFWFRRGWVIYGLVLTVCTSCSQVSSFDDLWFTKDYQGQRLSDKGEFEQAAGKYNDPMRKGVALYKAGDFEGAISAFSQDTTANGAYNLGLAYAQNGDFALANAALEKALEIDPGLEEASKIQQEINQLIPAADEAQLNEAEEQSQPNLGGEENQRNDGMEDLGGGGQEATEEQMNDGRLEEEVTTDIRTGKELDEVPEDMNISSQEQRGKVLMRKVDDDPALFLKKKFEYQVKKGQVKAKAND